jgi:hypothetical protein
MRNTLFLTAALCLFATTGIIAQPLSYDPFFVLPSSKGYKSVDLGLRSNNSSKILDATDTIFMSKFTPGDQIEVGARFTFGFFNETTSNFASLTVGSKYSLAPNRAVTLNIALPAGEIDDPGISLGIMNTLAISDKIQLNKQLFIGLLDGYTNGTGIIIDALLEPVLLLNPQWTAYLDLLISSNTDDFGNFLAVDFAPNIDWILSDGNALNFGLTIGLAGDLKSKKTGLAITLLRNM